MNRPAANPAPAPTMVQTTRRVVELAREDDALEGMESANAVSGESRTAKRRTVVTRRIIFYLQHL
jgi:hypothetical protein